MPVCFTQIPNSSAENVGNRLMHGHSLKFAKESTFSYVHTNWEFLIHSRNFGTVKLKISNSERVPVAT